VVERADQRARDNRPTVSSEMRVRGAPLIGATAAYGMALAMRLNPSDAHLDEAASFLHATRPTAINLRWAIDRAKAVLQPLPEAQRADKALAFIGTHGLALIQAVAETKKRDEPVNILTHCNAGWLATVDWGTATSPMFRAHDEGLNVHIWVGETRPRNQGALTSWELQNHGVPHTYIVDNAGGHLMQHGKVDMVIVGTDRTTRCGDVCNKIGTYLKALAAVDNNVPFYVALPSPTIDWNTNNGIAEIPIEERKPDEVSHLQGTDKSDDLNRVEVTPKGTRTANPAFDVTPNKMITGLITERGVCAASEDALSEKFPDLCN